MLTAFDTLLDDARDRGAAVGAFTAYNLETARGVLRAAEARRTGVILLVARNAFAASGGDILLAALVAAAEQAKVPACVQLDHVSDLELIERAFLLGCGAAMADGSRLGLDDNIAFTAEAARIAARHGAAVEAELGGIQGDEDVAVAVEAGALTDPDEVDAFVERTSSRCLAVSIGNVHGTYRAPPSLDWERLDAIRSVASVPLSLHGASGLQAGDLRRSISLGIAKVNVNTELRQAYLAVTEERLQEAQAGARVLELNAAQVDAVAAVVARTLDAFESAR